MKTMKATAIIEVDHVTKEFRLGQLTTLRHSLSGLVARMGGHRLAPPPRFKALDDVDFRVEPGEVLGIIGSNGAGKSTLLKLLAKITTPTTGAIRTRGRVAPLIEVGAGLIADLTGRENVYLNGIILGMSYRQIRSKLDEIVAFAELEEFIDTPIKRYSSGMHIRLGFSIATTVDADILIVDEVLAVGDLAFQRKCFDRMEQLIHRQDRTVLLVSHNTRQVERLCSRAMLLEHGRIVANGSPSQVCNLFYERSNEKMHAQLIAQQEKALGGDSSEVKLLHIHLLDEAGYPTAKIPYLNDWRIRVRFRSSKDLIKPIFGIGVHTADMLYLATHDSDYDLKLARIPAGEHELECVISSPPLVPGVYALRLGISERNGVTPAYYAENLMQFHITREHSSALPPTSPHGFFGLSARWTAPENFSETSVQREHA